MGYVSYVIYITSHKHTDGIFRDGTKYLDCQLHELI